MGVEDTHALFGSTHVFYIDESGDINAKGSPVFVLAAVGIENKDWDALNEEIALLKEEYFPGLAREDVEIKGRYIAAGKDVFRELTKAERDNFVNDLLSLMKRYVVVIMAVVIDKPHFIARRNSSDTMYDEAFEYLLERINIYLGRRGANGFLVMDSRGTSITGRKGPDNQIRQLYRIFKRQGTRFQTIHSVWEEPFFVASHYSPGIQLADMAAYSVYQVFSRAEQYHPWFTQLIGKLDVNPRTGRILGSGIKVFPGNGDLGRTIQTWEPGWLLHREKEEKDVNDIWDDIFR